MFLQTIKKYLLKIVDDIDAGNSNINEDEAVSILEMLKNYTDKTKLYSKYEACQYLNISRATFDNLVSQGKIPKGQKRQGFKELSWLLKDLEKVKNSNK